jgi:hypothetical protein
LLGDWIIIYLKRWLDYYLWLGLQYLGKLLMKLGGRRWIVNIILVKGLCLGVPAWMGKSSMYCFQSWRDVCFADENWEWLNSSSGEEFLIYTVALYAIFCRMLVWCLRMPHNSIVSSVVECICRKPNWWLGISLFFRLLGRALLRGDFQRFWIQWGGD